MISALYIEEAVRDHPRTQSLLERFAKVPHIECERYTQVFNRHGQDFRLQKQRPAMILAKKHGRLVHPTPPTYGIGKRHNYYFSHMLNCIYDCRYCFLQGLYQSANYVLFVNYEDFQASMDGLLAEHAPERVTFFSGFDCDSFALDGLTQFVPEHLEYMAAHPQAELELRTKSVKARDLLGRAPLANVIAAFSLTPEVISRTYEHGVPPLRKRLAVMRDLAEAGWPIGLRFDPVIAHDGVEAHYAKLLDDVFAHVAPEQVHSASLGAMRFPKGVFKQIHHLYPEEPLFSAGLKVDGSMVTYGSAFEKVTLGKLQEALCARLPDGKLFLC